MHDELHPAIGLFFLLIVLVGPLFLLIRFSLMLRRKDADRVRSYIEQRGGHLLTLKWAPFTTEWFFETRGRFYKVRYSDRDGNERTATCKTSMFSGVYFTDDQIVHYGGPPELPAQYRMAELEEENRRLREELEQAKQRPS